MYKKGFTLIELLVVIAVISLLSSVVLSSLNSARSKSRDTVKKQSLRELQKGLELFYDQYGRYPSGGCDSGSWSRSDNCPASFISGLTVGGVEFQQYISKLPSVFKSGQLFYYSSRLSIDNYQSYKVLYASSETETMVTGATFSRCPAGCSAGTYCGDNPGITPAYYSLDSGPNTAAACRY